MSTNNKISISLSFTEKECKQLLKKTGISRVSKDSINALNKLLTKRAREIANRAVVIAEENNRDLVNEKDITQAVRMTSAFSTFEVDVQAPVVHHVWFISSGGTCLLSHSYSGLHFPDTIFAGLLTGIFDLFSEVTGRMIDKFTTDDLTIHIRRIGDITVAVMNDSDRSEPIDELTDLLARRFSEVFAKEIEQDIIDTSIFDDFTPVLDALVTGAGLLIPTESLKVLKTSAVLTERQLQETVDATALRQELKRAQALIQQLAVFRKDEDEIGPIRKSKMDSLLDEPPDVKEIKAVLKQASLNIRDEFDDSDLKSETIKVDANKKVSKDIVSKSDIDFEHKKAIKDQKKKSKTRSRKRKKGKRNKK